MENVLFKTGIPYCNRTRNINIIHMVQISVITGYIKNST